MSVAGSHQNDDDAASSQGVTIPTVGVVLHTHDQEPYQVVQLNLPLVCNLYTTYVAHENHPFLVHIIYAIIFFSNVGRWKQLRAQLMIP